MKQLENKFIKIQTVSQQGVEAGNILHGLGFIPNENKRIIHAERLFIDGSDKTYFWKDSPLDEVNREEITLEQLKQLNEQN